MMTEDELYRISNLSRAINRGYKELVKYVLPEGGEVYINTLKSIDEFYIKMHHYDIMKENK